jgi:hypothetical protein
MMLRGNLSQDWIKYIAIVVEQYNKTPNKKLGGLTPQSIHSEYDSALVNEARKLNKVSIFEEPHFQQQILNQKRYEEDKTKLQIDDYVYVSSNEKLFDKSFDTQVSKT